MNINELNARINKAENFREVSSIIQSESYFAEYEDNDVVYYAEWFLELSEDDKYFATVSNFDKEYDKQYHITVVINDDVNAIKSNITKIKQLFEDDKIDYCGYCEEIELAIANIKIKDARLEEV